LIYVAQETTRKYPYRTEDEKHIN